MIRHNGHIWAQHTEHATRWHQRLRGLLGRPHLPDSTAMIIHHCNAIHTIGMRFPIDVVFVDKQGKVLKVATNIPPGHPCIWGTWHATHAIETHAGKLDTQTLHPGDHLEF